MVFVFLVSVIMEVFPAYVSSPVQVELFIYALELFMRFGFCVPGVCTMRFFLAVLPMVVRCV